MTTPNYAKLKATFTRSEDEFYEKFTKDILIARSVIATIANAKNDGLWPLAMLRAFQPQLSNALLHWTAGESENIRKEQESRMVKVGSHAHHMEQYFSLLPVWHNEAFHFSKDPAWFKKLECGSLELKSFMGCSSPGHTFSYTLPHAVVLRFSSLKTARLVGALTTDHLEGEILLPRRATYRVVNIHKRSKTIYLEEYVQNVQNAQTET